MHAMRFNVFCRVIDNYGDIGVCWRLSADLAGRGHHVTLWTDDARALAWMAPQGCPGVQVRPWDDATDLDDPGDVVIEAFGCELAQAVIARMASRPPVWINLEYLSAEAYVERSHGLPSPIQHGAGRGLTKFFFYPGFTAATGGLLREPGLLQRRRRFDARAWLSRHVAEIPPGERLASVFCYAQPALPLWLDQLAGQPQRTRLLLSPGPAVAIAQAWLDRPLEIGQAHARGAVTVQQLPWLTQREHDHLLWSCDLNLVRGEDTLVRALWAGKPLLWQLYPQSDEAQLIKLRAFLDWGWPPQEAHGSARRMLWRAWNGESPPGQLDWDLMWRDFPPQAAHLWADEDLTSRLLAFVARQANRTG